MKISLYTCYGKNVHYDRGFKVNQILVFTLNMLYVYKTSEYQNTQDYYYRQEFK